MALLRILLVGAVAYVAYRLFRSWFSGRGARPRFKCATCRNCKEIFDDGVLCVFEGRETFKNETHIANCPDHETAGRG